jgi:hypothetical protein
MCLLSWLIKLALAWLSWVPAPLQSLSRVSSSSKQALRSVATWSVSFPAVQWHSQVSGALPPFFMAWLMPSLKISVVFSRFVPQPLHHYVHRAPPPLRSGSATGKTSEEAIAHISSCAVAHGFPCFRYSYLRSSAGGARFAQMVRQPSTASVEQQAYPSAKKPQFADAPFVHFFWKLARLTQATFWGLPSNLGDDSRAVLHTLVGVLHSAPLGEERSEKERGKGTGISVGSPYSSIKQTVFLPEHQLLCPHLQPIRRYCLRG